MKLRLDFSLALTIFLCILLALTLMVEIWAIAEALL